MRPGILTPELRRDVAELVGLRSSPHPNMATVEAAADLAMSVYVQTQGSRPGQRLPKPTLRELYTAAVHHADNGYDTQASSTVSPYDYDPQ